jgi:SNF2 family DNA or RNA helicase
VKRGNQAAAALQTDPTVRVLVGNTHAAGTGITLTAAIHVLFNDLDWAPGNHRQAEDRIYRIGQTRPAFVTYLYAENTLDDFVAALPRSQGTQHRRTRGRSRDQRVDDPGVCGGGRAG